MRKYRNKKVVINGVQYDSRKEAQRHYFLIGLQEAGQISNLQTQVKFELVPKQKGERAVNYVADFVYQKNGEMIVEDVKGYKGGGAYSVFVIKRKLMLYKYGISIQEV